MTMPPDDDATQVTEASPGLSVRTSHAPTSLAGATAGSWILEREIGAGGGGVVWLARQPSSGRRAALKILRRELVDSPTMLARFSREILAVNAIRHPGVVEAYEVGRMDDGRPYFAMEYLRGTDLNRYLYLHGRLAPTEALEILEPVCRCLAAAHQAGFVHRDLKASNIHLVDTDQGRVVKVLDWGIAKLLHPEPGSPGLTETGMMLGTCHAMAPEQILATGVDARSDVYALGALLFRLLTARHVFTSENTSDVLLMHLQAKPPRPSEFAPVPPAIDEVVARSLAKSPSDRYSDVMSFLADLRRACGLGGAVPGQQSSTRGVAIVVLLRCDLEAADDVVAGDVMDALAIAEAWLTSAGYRPCVQTADTLIAVRLPDDGEMVDILDVDRCAEELERTLAARPTADNRIEVHVQVREDEVTVVQNAEGQVEIIGGPLVELDEGTPERTIPDAPDF